MICPHCREAADKVKPKLHKKCPGKGACDCQHRKGHWINQEIK